MGPIYAEEVFLAAGGPAWFDPALTDRERSMVIIAALAALGVAGERLDGHVRSAERPAMMRKLADVAPGLVRQDLLKVASLAGLMQVVPAHDLTAYEGIPQLASHNLNDLLTSRRQFAGGDEVCRFAAFTAARG